MGACPEVVGEVVKVGGDHVLDAVVDDGEGVVGPKVAANVGEVLVFEEELVTEAGVEHELGLVAVEVSMWQSLPKKQRGLTGGVMSFVTLS